MDEQQHNSGDRQCEFVVYPNIYRFWPISGNFFNQPLSISGYFFAYFGKGMQSGVCWGDSLYPLGAPFHSLWSPLKYHFNNKPTRRPINYIRPYFILPLCERLVWFSLGIKHAAVAFTRVCNKKPSSSSNHRFTLHPQPNPFDNIFPWRYSGINIFTFVVPVFVVVLVS